VKRWIPILYKSAESAQWETKISGNNKCCNKIGP
jgi:hypothetical protein